MQLFPLKIIPDNSNFDFYNMRKFSYKISSLLILLSLILILFRGFNLGIDFVGGINIEASSERDVDLSKVRSALSKIDIGDFTLHHFGSKKIIAIKSSAGKRDSDSVNNSIIVNNIKQSLKDHSGYEFEYRQVDFVGPQVGNHLIKSGVIAVLLSFVSIMIYVWIRFEWQFGIGVLMALVHNIIISLGFMSASMLDFNLSTVAALLIIIGYSVNDSVVIYDRIRENIRKYGSKNIVHMINLSVNETLTRTTITSITTLLANLALIIFATQAIKSFSMLVFFGIFVGTYSSIFLSSQILTAFNFKKFSE